MEKGVGLADVLISLFLASLITLLLIQMYLSHKRDDQQFQTQLEKAFDLERVSDLMRQSVMNAGFTPCLPLSHLTIKDLRPAAKAPHDLVIQTQPYSALQTARMSEHFTSVRKIGGSKKLWLAAQLSINPKRPMIIADCFHAEIHNIDAIKPHPDGLMIYLEKPLSFSYRGKVYFGEWLEETWFVRPNKQGKKALYLRAYQTEALSSIIHSLHLKKQRQLIEIQLGLDDGHSYRFSTLMRNA